MGAFPSLLSQQPVPTSLAGLSNFYSSQKWIAVRQRFQRFQQNLSLTPLQQLDGFTKRDGVVSCLNRHYYSSNSNTDNSFMIGSWAKGVATAPPRDLDLYFVLPYSVYERFQANARNRQSGILQELRGVLGRTYPNTNIKGDGPVVLVPYTSYGVEIVPAFLLTNGGYWICNTRDGGAYRETNPWIELTDLETVDKANNNNLRPLIRMLKAWQANCSVPIKSIQLELLAKDFLAASPWRMKDYFWFDWIARDFFAYLYYRANYTAAVPGTAERISLGNAWQSRTETAYFRAEKACRYEQENQVEAAGDEWQKIFGSQIPRTV